MDYELYQVKEPATFDEVLKLEAKVGCVFSPSYRAMLRRHNGATYFEPLLMKEIQFLSTSQVSEYMDAYGLVTHMPGGIPFAMDGCGNFILFNSQSETDSVFVASCGNLGWADAIQVAGSFKDFLEDPKRPEAYLHAQQAIQADAAAPRRLT